jgi:hypothetical protein
MAKKPASSKKSKRSPHEQQAADLLLVKETAWYLSKKLGFPEPLFPSPYDKRTSRLFHNPSRCPICKSSEIDAGNWDGNGTRVTCTVTCNACHATWVEEYAMINAFNFNLDDVPLELW